MARALGIICIVVGLTLVMAAILLVLLVQTSTEEVSGVSESNSQSSQAAIYPTPPLPHVYLEYRGSQYQSGGAATAGRQARNRDSDLCQVYPRECGAALFHLCRPALCAKHSLCNKRLASRR